jgi:alanine dehydrogenase
MSRILNLDEYEVKELLSMSEALVQVEDAFRLEAEAKAIMPPKLYLDLPNYHGDFRAMPAYIDGAAGLKWVSVYPENTKYNLPCVLATIIICDPNTGYPIAIIDGTYITSIRTGAAGGIAVKYLARKDSSVIGLIGAGRQARTQLLAINEVLPRNKEVKVFDLVNSASRRFAEEMGAKLNINIRPVEKVEEAAEADILVTTTTSTKPIVKRSHLKPGTHINAIGADAKGKQELEAAILKDAKIIVDDIDQASHSGEINVPLSEGKIKISDVRGTLGEIIIKAKQGRVNDKEITIFDSTGLAIQDIMCAKHVYEKYLQRHPESRPEVPSHRSVQQEKNVVK